MTYRCVINWSPTNSYCWISRWLWTGCLNISHTVAGIRAIHIDSWSRRIGVRETASSCSCMGRCWRSKPLGGCCCGLIIVHNCKDNTNTRIKTNVIQWMSSRIINKPEHIGCVSCVRHIHSTCTTNEMNDRWIEDAYLIELVLAMECCCLVSIGHLSNPLGTWKETNMPLNVWHNQKSIEIVL